MRDESIYNDKDESWRTDTKVDMLYSRITKCVGPAGRQWCTLEAARQRVLNLFAQFDELRKVYIQ